MDISVVVPLFNEDESLPELTAWIDKVMTENNFSYEIILVDDGSTDGTSAVADDFPAITFSGLPCNQGKGAAVRHGMLMASGGLILMMDADLATPLSEFDLLKESITAGADIAIGSRPLQTSTLSVRQPLLRELAGRLFNFIVRSVSGLPFKDTQCGFKLWKSGSAKESFTRCASPPERVVALCPSLT